jgi:TatD DNase family protein
VIDSHCHLADAKFDADIEAVLTRAKAAGVTQMVTIADSMAEAEKCIRLAEKYDQLFCTVGVHPHNAKDWKAEDVKTITRWLETHSKIRAIGEIGLDYHYDFSPREQQRSAFETQLLLAKTLDLPAVVHCREAVDDVWTVTSKIAPPKLVIHCCTEKWSDVEKFVKNGYWLSFTGIATYPNAGDIRETIRQCPLDQLMIETDAPYLAPVPHRGKRNEPAFVAEVCAVIAKEKGIDAAEVDRVTTKNAVEFFGLLP